MVQLINFFQGLPGFGVSSFLSSALSPGVAVTATSTGVTYLNQSTGAQIVFHGSFQVAGNVVTGGTATGFDLFAGPTLLEQATGFSVASNDLLSAVAAYQAFDDDPFIALFLSNTTQIGTAGIDRMYGTGGTMKGLAGDDSFRIDEGAGIIFAGKGDDFAFVSSGEMYGGGGNDRMFGGDGSIFAKGGAGGDMIGTGASVSTVYGNKGADLLIDREGVSLLFGGHGDDFFAFDRADGVAVIGDFNPKHDTIGLRFSEFANMDAGILSKDAFVVGSAATTPDQRVIYNDQTGALLYDRDGSLGVYAAVQIATLSNLPNLHARDVVVYFDYALSG